MSHPTHSTHSTHSMHAGQSFGFTQKPIILLVDDSPDNIALLSDLLKEPYKIRIAANGIKALQIAAPDPLPIEEQFRAIAARYRDDDTACQDVA